MLTVFVRSIAVRNSQSSFGWAPAWEEAPADQFARLVPDGDRLFVHTAEGDDDMPAHIRSALTAVNLSLPVSHGRLALGTWQGIYLWEHRRASHARTIVLHFVGE